MTYETIRYGSSGQKVRKLQTMLKDQGYDLEVDGRFGPKTRRVVTQYQQANRLRPDGIVSAHTWNTLTGRKRTARTDPATTERDTRWKIGTYDGSAVTGTSDGRVTETKAAQVASAARTQSGQTARPTSEYTPSPEVIAAEEELKELEDSRPGEYESRYSQELEALYDQIIGRPDFSYDLGADPMYQQYRQQYITQGRLAMEDTMGMAAGLTGGYGSSYSQNAGQQAYGSYLQGLHDRVPQLYELALDRYAAQGQALADRYAMIYDLEGQDYDRYSDDYDRWFRDYSQAQDALEAIREEDYERYLDMLEAQEKAAGSSESSGSSTKEPDSASSSGSTKKSDSASSGSSTKKSGSKQTAAMSDADIRRLAQIYIDSGYGSNYWSWDMIRWMRGQGIEEEMDDRFYEALRELGYEPNPYPKGSNSRGRDIRIN